MSGWRALARELGVLPSTTKPTELTKPGPREVSSVLSVLSQGKEPLSRDLFEERAAIREHDSGLSREEGEALAVTPGAPALDAEGLPCQPCARCGGGDYWKPMALALEGDGWRCATCRPPGVDEWRHACSVPA